MFEKAWRKFVPGLLFVCIAVLAASGVRLSAQVVKGSISGTIVDTSGAVIPDAEIKAVEASTGATSSTVSGADGGFRLFSLSVGTYTLTVTKQGFRSLTMTDVGVNSARDSGLGELKLQLGTQTTSVEVSAAPPLVETTQSQVSTSISGSVITVFPGLGGNIGMDQLALQIPGVVNTRANNFSNTDGVGFSVNGLRGRSNDQQIDGQANNDNSVTGPSLFIGNPDFVQEYQVTTQNFSAEYGRNSGSVVNYIGKSGTNTWHGDLFGTEANAKLNSLSNTQKAFEGLHSVPPFNDEFSGASIGGPVRRDKLFVFGLFDNEIIPGVSNFSTGSLTPDPAGLTALQACFPNSPSVSALVTYGPWGIKEGNPVISGTPTTKTLIDPNGNPCPVEFAGIQRVLSTAYKQWDHVERLDWNGTKDKMFGRYMYQKSTPLNATGTGATGYSGDVPGFSNQLAYDWTHTLKPTMVNEFRLNYTRATAQFGGNSYGNTLPPIGGLANALASIGISSGYLGYGVANNLPQGRIINTYQLQDNWSWFKGKHQFKAGTNLTYQRSPNVFLPNYNGTYTFSASKVAINGTTYSVSAFNSYALDRPSSIAITLGNPNLDFREHQSFFYFQDDWKLKPNLTFNLGLTWSYFGQPANLFHTSDLKNETGSAPFFNPALPLSLRVFPELSSPKNNWGPNVGFAYTPHWGGGLTGNGKTVLRGGFRIAYDPAFYNIYLNIASASPQVLSQTITGANALASPLPADPHGPNIRSELAPYLTLGVSDPRQFNETTVTPDFHSDRVYSWSFGIQRELVSHAVVESRYVGNHGSNLFQSVNTNPYVAGIAAAFPNLLPSGVTPCPASQAVVAKAIGRVNCNLGQVRLRTNTSMSDYHGWQNELRATNLWNQLTLRTAFTLSKTTDNASDIFNTGSSGNTIAFSQNPFDYVHGEHSLSGLDIPRNWTLSFVEELPMFRSQHGLAGHVLGGWKLAGDYILAAGQPYTPMQYALAYSTGANTFDVGFNSTWSSSYENLRPFYSNPAAPANMVGILAADACSYAGVGCELSANALLNFNLVNTTGAEQQIQGSQVRYIMNGVQSQSVYGTPWGNVGRNTLRTEGINSADFSVYKYTNITERLKVRFDTTFLNVFNHPNGFGIDPYLDDAGYLDEGTGFAVPTLFSGGSRAIKFGLRVEF